MRPKGIYRTILPLVACLLVFTGTALADTADMDQTDVPEEWADTYTPEELGAIDRALWAANMVREDLSFRKDYTHGYGCFPIVREWMADPLSIAPDMDAMIARFEDYKQVHLSPWTEYAACAEYFPETENTRGQLDFSTRMTSKLVLAAYKTSGEELSEDQEWLIDSFRGALHLEIPTNLTVEELEMLRHYAPYQLAWHDVFESPYPEDRTEAWDEFLESQSDDYLYQLMAKTGFAGGTPYYSCAHPDGWLDELPRSAFPSLTPTIIETDYGRIALGTYQDDTYEGDFAVLIDPGGDDHYINCRIGAAYGTENRRYGYFVDLEGDDFYDCGDTNITLGAAILGVAAFYDLGQGNDRYVAGSCSLGAAMCGVATFYDDGGSDTYEGRVFTQGAAGFGIGIMVDDSVQPAPVVPTDEETPDPIDIGAFDNDRYSAWTNSQAFARTLGFAICSNKRGNEIYEAGGVYLHAPLFADRYQSFSQGFAIGERGIDYAGGIALIVDYDGNDRYLGDVYNQGVGYWYSAGLVYDGGGNDTYEMTQYGQGSGIHLAIGGLIDVSGDDSYTMHAGLGTGGSHDFAASVLHDRGGNDQYFGNTSCNGGSLTNSAVIFIDRSGNDTYAGRRSGGINFGRPARGFNSIGVLVDLSGEDDYLGIMDNGMLWSQTNVGVGWDIIPPPVPEEEVEPEPERGGLGEDVPLPEIISYEGDLTQEVFDELWEISVRWEVGDNRFIVPHARDRLIAFGSDTLPYISAEFDNQHSGLAIRAFDYILGQLLEVDRDGVIQIVGENLASDVEMRRRVALAEISTLTATELEDQVAEILNDPDPEMQRRAIATLGTIDSHAADDTLLANLDPSNEEALIKVCMETLFDLEVYCFDELRPLLDYPYITVRETLIGRLAANIELYDPELREALLFEAGRSPVAYIPPPLSIRALRSILKIYTTADWPPDESLMDAIYIFLEHEDWGVRADAIRVIQHWKDVADETLATSGDPSYAMYLESLVEPLLDRVDEILEDETDPYVLFVGSGAG